MPASTRTPRLLTGRKVLLIAVAAFGVIITANMALLYSAIGSFPGLEVKNTYVASQHFDADRAAQAKLGWSVSTGYEDGKVFVSLSDKNGASVVAQNITAFIGRATHSNADVTLNFEGLNPPYLFALPLDKGKWELRIAATALDGTAFRQRLELWVK